MGKREYKDTVFVDLFFHCEQAKENFTSLFKALCAFLNIDFDFDMQDLQPLSLETSLYNRCRTDVLYNIKNSFLVFIEHQSTINPNMPLRELEYAIEVLKKISDERAKYSRTPLELKDVIFINLYNGREKNKEIYDSYLSDLVKIKIKKDVSLELKVTNININAGHNERLLKACTVLEGYSLFVAEARKQLELDEEKGFEIAVDNCIKQGILSEYLNENRRGVMGLFFGEFDMDTALEVAREESYDEGIERGIEQGIERGIEQGIERGIEQGLYAKAIETAKKLLEMNLSLRNIAIATGLNEDEIEQLKR